MGGSEGQSNQFHRLPSIPLLINPLLHLLIDLIKLHPNLPQALLTGDNEPRRDQRVRLPPALLELLPGSRAEDPVPGTAALVAVVEVLASAEDRAVERKGRGTRHRRGQKFTSHASFFFSFSFVPFCFFVYFYLG